MAPLRRYLRITKYSVLECRIYLDEPALAHSWLLHPRNPILPRVIESVRPLVLPKLREERERSRKKSTKKRGIKDTVTEGTCCPHNFRSPCSRCMECSLHFFSFFIFFLFFFGRDGLSSTCFILTRFGGGGAKCILAPKQG